MKANGYNAVLFTGFNYTRSGTNCYTDILLLEDLEEIVNQSSSESIYKLLNYSSGDTGDETGLVTIRGGTGKITNTRVTLIKL